MTEATRWPNQLPVTQAIPSNGEPVINVTDPKYGARADDGITDNRGPIMAAWVDALKSGLDLYFPPGAYNPLTTGQTYGSSKKYHVKGDQLLDFAFGEYNYCPVKIRGAHPMRSQLYFPDMTGGLAVKFRGATDYVFPIVSDIAFQGYFPGIMGQIGENDYSAPTNFACFTRVMFQNGFPGDLAKALRVNYIVNSSFRDCIFNCYTNAGRDAQGNAIEWQNRGTAVEIRSGGFTKFDNCSAGNARYGYRFIDGQSNSVNFDTGDIENVDYCIRHDSGSSGSHNSVCTRFGNYKIAAASSTGGRSDGVLDIYTPNYGTFNDAPFLDLINNAGITIHNNEDVPTAPVPASGTPIENNYGKRVSVLVSTNATTTIYEHTTPIILAAGATCGFIIGHKQSITLVYPPGQAPTWRWKAMQ